MPDLNVIVPNGEHGPIALEDYAAANAAAIKQFGKGLRPATPDDLAILQQAAAARAEAGAPSTSAALAGDLGLPSWAAPAVSAGLGAVSGATWGLGNKINAAVRALPYAQTGQAPAIYQDERLRGASVYEDVARENPKSYAAGTVVPALIAGGLARAPAALGPLLGAELGAAPVGVRAVQALGGLAGSVGGAGLGGYAASEAPSGSPQEAEDMKTAAMFGALFHGAGGAAQHAAPIFAERQAVARAAIDPTVPNLGPLERLMTTTTPEGKGAVAPGAMNAARGAAATLGGTAGAAVHPLLTPAGGALGFGAGELAAQRLARSGIAKIDAAAAARAQAAEMTYARERRPSFTESPYDRGQPFETLPYEPPPPPRDPFDLNAPSVARQTPWEPPPPPEPVDPTTLPAPELARPPRGRAYEETPTAAPEHEPLADEGLANVLAGVEAELGLTPAPSLPARVEPLSSPTEARPPEMQPSGGTLPKGPGVAVEAAQPSAQARGINALQAERVAAADYPGRPVSPTPAEPAGQASRRGSTPLSAMGEETPLEGPDDVEAWRTGLDEAAIERARMVAPRDVLPPGEEGPYPRDLLHFFEHEAHGHRPIDRESPRNQDYQPIPYDPLEPQPVKTDHIRHVEEKYQKLAAFDALQREAAGLPPRAPEWPMAPRETLNVTSTTDRSAFEKQILDAVEAERRRLPANANAEPQPNLVAEHAARLKAEGKGPYDIATTLRYEGASHEAIAEALGTSPDDVRALIQRGKLRAVPESAPTPLEPLMVEPAPESPKALPAPSAEEIVGALREQGATPHMIAQRLKMPIGDVKRILARRAWTKPLPGGSPPNTDKPPDKK